ncbi:unnamed protein product [Caenorhabditis sp. 36 PRJEB53466]|nr:unnamed protein product [Caenorhabditis sp. 36 PRJEB53466]
MNGSSFGYFSQPFPEPAYFSLHELRDEIVQTSPLLRLNDDILDMIIEHVPLKDRLLKVRSVCHKLSDSVKRSVKSIEYLRDELDYCDDDKISFFLSVYGKNVEHINYDLFRSCSLLEYTQWSWRQSVILSVTKCPQLKQLDILVCCRHRLRDGDLAVIFKQCNQLEVLRMDANFINGHCFFKAPQSLKKIELECCQSMNKSGILGICSRLHKLQTLHLSLFTNLDEQVIKKISEMRNLRNLSIIADPEQPMNQFRLTDLRRLPKLSLLCLDGVNNVTDKFLADLCDASAAPASKTLEHISLAWCKNIGSNGVSKLKNLQNLKSLNLDGVSKRDISIGVEAIGNCGRLERLLISEDAFVSPKTVVEFVNKCESLRTLDVSNNHRLSDKSFAEQVYSARAYSFGKPMVILTDNKFVWRRLPPFSFSNRVEVVVVNDRYPDEYVESISKDSAQQLPRGFLIPDLRRGNRYKMLDYNRSALHSGSLSPEPNQENMPPQSMMDVGELSEKEQEEFARMLMELQAPFQNVDWMQYSQLVVPQAPPPGPSFTDFENSITVGTAGAPGPPKAEKILKHTRPSRPKRQAQKERAQQRRSGKVAQAPEPVGPKFTEDDFPPLG